MNVNVRPYYSEGSKTLAYEVAEQLGWSMPHRCIVPIASGSLYTKSTAGSATSSRPAWSRGRRR